MYVHIMYIMYGICNNLLKILSFKCDVRCYALRMFKWCDEDAGVGRFEKMN